MIHTPLSVSHGDVTLRLPGTHTTLWVYETKNNRIEIPAPVFEIDGHDITLAVEEFCTAAVRDALCGVKEYSFEGTIATHPALSLTVSARIAEKSPFVRFCYTVAGRGRLTRSRGCDAVTYLHFNLNTVSEVREIRISDFHELIHSYMLTEETVPRQSFDDRYALIGPIICGTDGLSSRLCAYEHGSQPPLRFLEFVLGPDRCAALRAVRGNYWHGRDLLPGYQTIWFDIGIVEGGFDALAEAWREFVLRWMSPNAASRTPYIFYNTWNFQERHQAWEKGNYPVSYTHLTLPTIYSV